MNYHSPFNIACIPIPHNKNHIIRSIMSILYHIYRKSKLSRFCSFLRLKDPWCSTLPPYPQTKKSVEQDRRYAGELDVLRGVYSHPSTNFNPFSSHLWELHPSQFKDMTDDMIFRISRIFRSLKSLSLKPKRRAAPLLQVMQHSFLVAKGLCI